MEKIPEYKLVGEARKTHKASKKLSPEDRETIQMRAFGSVLAFFVQTHTPETVAEALREYYQKHPELIKPLERLEKLVKAAR